jgi:glycosyltransferase involved in cell wall biosynthesis
MKILLCHTYYRIRGGEDLSFEAEARLLEEAGHDVVRFTRHNDAMQGMGGARAAWTTIWNHGAYREVREVLRRERPDVMHCTNTFPLLSPAVYHAAAREGVPVVQALRNYRLLCVNSYLLRDGRICESCLGRCVPWPGALRGCYRASAAASTAVAAMLGIHRVLGSWRNKIALFYTPSEFARQKYVDTGFPAERVRVKPNFLDPDPGPGTGRGGYALFAGRLSAEKGLDLLLDVWQRLPTRAKLRIIGEGPLAERVRAIAAESPHIDYLGARSHADVLEMVGEASFVIYPSLWYETFGRTIMEAFACGTPVVATRLGAMSELVDDGLNGWLFEAHDAVNLMEKLRTAIATCSPASPIREAARRTYLRRFTASVNLPLLLDLYHRAMGRLPVTVRRREPNLPRVLDDATPSGVSAMR